MMAMAVLGCMVPFFRKGAFIAGREIARIIKRIINMRIIKRSRFLRLIFLLCFCWLSLINCMELKITLCGFFLAKRYINSGIITTEVKNKIPEFRKDILNIFPLKFYIISMPGNKIQYHKQYQQLYR